MVPLGRVEGRALELLDPRDRRDRRAGELAAGGDQDVELVALAGVGDQRPAPRLVVEGRADRLDAEAQVRREPEVLAQSLEVVEDLRLGRVAARPVVAGRERERVEVRGHVAGGAGVGVGAPDAADGLAALEDREVLDSRSASAGSRSRRRRNRRRRCRPRADADLRSSCSLRAWRSLARLHQGPNPATPRSAAVKTLGPWRPAGFGRTLGRGGKQHEGSTP